MRRVKVLLDFIKASVAMKIEFFRHVIASITGNPTFPEPDVPVATLTTSVNTLATDYLASLSGNHEARAKMLESEKATNELFRQTAMYVDRIAKGSEAIILSSGFHASHRPNPSVRPVFSVELGENPGEVILHCKAVPGARSYVWQICTSNEPKEESFVFAGSSTRTTFIIRGLNTLTKHWFRGCAVTSMGMQPWFDPIAKTL